MATKGMGVNICLGLAARLKVAIQFAAEHSIYQQCISMIELTTAQTVILSIFHCLLKGDMAAVHSLLSIIPYLPQIRSSFIGVWLRDDYRFRQEDVAKVLSTLAKLVKQEETLVPLPVIIAFSGLEEKYDVFSFFRKSGDVTAQGMLACLNPLVTRATQVGPECFENQAIESRVCTETTSTQTESQIKKSEEITLEDFGIRNKELDRLPIPSSSTKEQTTLEKKCREKNKDSDRLPIPSTSQNADTFQDCRRQKKDPEGLSIPSSSTAQLLLHQADAVTPVQFLPIIHPIIVAAENTARSLIEEYLDSERMEDYINVPDIEGNLPIHRAALDGRTDVVEALLQQGAGPNDMNSFNMTPLQMAISSCQTDTIIFLLSHGASLQSKDIMGMTPLHHAAHYGDPEIIRILLSYRVNKEAKDGAGNRPLHVASKFGHTEAVRLLINAGANRKVRDCEGFRPIDWALKRGDSEMFRILRVRGHRFI